MDVIQAINLDAQDKVLLDQISGKFDAVPLNEAFTTVGDLMCRTACPVVIFD